jgi:hypothetical protein
MYAVGILSVHGDGGVQKAQMANIEAIFNYLKILKNNKTYFFNDFGSLFLI